MNRETLQLFKQNVIQRSYQLILDKLNEFEVTERSAQESAANDTKSSMGDKHETSREILQQEREMNGRRMAEALRQKEEIERILPDAQFSMIQIGSLAETSLGWFFFSTALGFVYVDDTKVAVVSMASPIGQALKGLKAGDSILFQGKSILIKNII
jgi:transcription elongation GreA/GreB family factor